MIPKQDRQGVRHAKDIEQKYELNLDFADISRNVADAKKTATQADKTADNAKRTAEEAKSAAIEAETNAKNYTDDQMKLLWENESPADVFVPQTVALDLSAHELVAIKFRVKDAICKTVIGSVGDTILLDAVCPTTNTSLVLAYRNATTADSGVTFGSGMYQTNGATASNDDTYIVPCQIYGMKGRSNENEREDEEVV